MSVKRISVHYKAEQRRSFLLTPDELMHSLPLLPLSRTTGSSRLRETAGRTHSKARSQA